MSLVLTPAWSMQRRAASRHKSLGARCDRAGRPLVILPSPRGGEGVGGEGPSLGETRIRLGGASGGKTIPQIGPPLTPGPSPQKGERGEIHIKAVPPHVANVAPALPGRVACN